MDDFKHSVPLLGGGQENFQQCWYASYGMLLKYHKRNANEVDGKLAGAGIKLVDAKDKGLLDTDYKRAADSLGLKMWSGAPFKKDPSWYDIGLTDGAEAFIEQLKIALCGFHDLSKKAVITLRSPSATKTKAKVTSSTTIRIQGKKTLSNNVNIRRTSLSATSPTRWVRCKRFVKKDE